MISELKYYKIDEEWNSIFSIDEKETIIQVFQPLGFNKEENTNRVITESSASLIAFLSNLLGWFKKPQYYVIGKKIITLCEKHIDSINSILDLHFYYQNKIQFYYANRTEVNEALNYAIESCDEQIRIATKSATGFKKEWKSSDLPNHIGYKQLAIILEKQKKWDQLIMLCEKAKDQGWKGDWIERIEKANRKRSC